MAYKDGFVGCMRALLGKIILLKEMVVFLTLSYLFNV